MAEDVPDGRRSTRGSIPRCTPQPQMRVAAATSCHSCCRCLVLRAAVPPFVDCTNTRLIPAGRSASGMSRTTASASARRRRRRTMRRSRRSSRTLSPRRSLPGSRTACSTRTSTRSSTRAASSRASRRGLASAAGATASCWRARSSSSTSSAWRARRSKCWDTSRARLRLRGIFQWREGPCRGFRRRRKPRDRLHPQNASPSHPGRVSWAASSGHRFSPRHTHLATSQLPVTVAFLASYAWCGENS
jgi:hypothetical protein